MALYIEFILYKTITSLYKDYMCEKYSCVVKTEL